MIPITIKWQARRGNIAFGAITIFLLNDLIIVSEMLYLAFLLLFLQGYMYNATFSADCLTDN